MSGCKIECLNNGAYRISGDFIIVDGVGKEFDLSGRTVISLCRCGSSKNKPFCDASHNETGFQSTVKAKKLPPKK